MKLHSKYYFPLTVNVIEYDDFGTIDYSDEGCEYDGSCAQKYEKEIKDFFEQYTQGDEDMVTYFRDRGNKLLSMKWGFEDRKEQLFGVVDVTHTEVLSETEVSAIKDYILGQNSDGLGEGFEQQDIEIDDGIINVHFWSSDDAYRIYTEDEFDEFIEQSKEYELKDEKLYGMIVLPDSAFDMLLERKENAVTKWIFPRQDNPELPMHPNGLNQKLGKILDRLDIPKISFHDLRHTFATYAAKNGVDPKTLASILGHTNASFTLDTYTHVTGDMQRSASKVVGRFLDDMFGDELTETEGMVL